MSDERRVTGVTRREEVRRQRREGRQKKEDAGERRGGEKQGKTPGARRVRESKGGVGLRGQE